MASNPGRGLLDRFAEAVSPGWALNRERTRAQLGRLRGARVFYEGASVSRRTAGWRNKSTSANSELSPKTMAMLRGIAHDLVRNNAFAARGVAALAENIVGTGITFQVYRRGKIDQSVTELARRHFDTKACDALGQLDLYGLQLQAARTIVEAGACVVRRRWRRASDGLPVPMQLQLLEPDYVDASKQGPAATGGGFRINGIEFDGIGRRSGYWIYAGHPGGAYQATIDSRLIAAEEIAHAYRVDRPEQMHGATWFSPIIVRLKDFGDYEDAQLVRQKIAACYTAFRVGDPDATDTQPQTDSNGTPLETEPLLEALEPGIIEDLPPGVDIKFAEPPTVSGYGEYSSVSLHAVSTGLGVPYEVLTGDHSEVSFISGRLGRLQFKRSCETWQYQMLIPMLCEPIGQWFLEAAAMQGVDVKGCEFRWTPPRFEMMDPATEVPAIRDAIRSGQKTISQAARERGEDPDIFLAEWAADAERLDALGLVFDSDPRRVTAVGNAVQPTSAARESKPAKG